jgi:Ketopantoate reductase PanE/ApbA
MTKHSRPRILVIGAGSMGIIMGYYLSLGGAEVTFLVRPHRVEALAHPQILYSYDDNSLKEYKGYTYITHPTDMVGANYDFILITLDAASLRNEVGQNLVKTIGEAVRGTNTKVILGSVFVNLQPWFLQLSGLTREQVASGSLSIHAYPQREVILPLHPPTDPELLAKADLAYADRLGPGFNLFDDSSPAITSRFKEIYNANGVSYCEVQNAAEFALSIDPSFAILAACSLLDWPKFQDINGNGELWSLALPAVKEIQRLSIHGEKGQEAAIATTQAGFAASFAALENQMLPLDFQEFNRFHHGGKVNASDCENLAACIALGEAEGKPMFALKELLRRVEDRQGVAVR